jgi:prepilin-type N-terminal cleavage/methylation domain-containing protein
MKKGFTLIELLVVVAIISLLSSIVLATLNDTRDKARQSAYKQYLIQVMSAIELRKLSAGDYPTQMFLDDLVQGNMAWSGLGSYIAYSEPPAFVGIYPSNHPANPNRPTIAFSRTEYKVVNGVEEVDSAEDCGRIAENRVDGYYISFQGTSNNLNFPRLYSKNGVIPNWFCISDLVR